MARFTASDNVSAFTFESGTYGTASGTDQWVGLVQDFSPEDTQNVNRFRYHGTTTRNVDISTPGPEDYGGTIEFYPQDLRFLMFALGNGSDSTTGSPAYYTHTLTELNSNDAAPMVSGASNPFTSFTFKSTQQHATGFNLNRVYNGCNVDSMTLSCTQGEPVSTSVSFIAQNMVPNSGAAIAPTESTKRPYLWSDSLIHLPSGTKLDVKSWELQISNNFDKEGAHVCNGSRVMKNPSATERDYTFNLTMDSESTQAMRLFGYWKSGGNLTVNAAIELLNYGKAASGASFITMSGCDVDSFDAPNPVEGLDEWSLTLIPKQVTAVTQDNVEKYKAW